MPARPHVSKEKRQIRTDKFDACSKRNFYLGNSWKLLNHSCLHELHESKLPFISLTEFIRCKLSIFFAHIMGSCRRRRGGAPASIARSSQHPSALFRPVWRRPSVAGGGFDGTERTGTRSEGREQGRDSADGCGEDRASLLTAADTTGTAVSDRRARHRLICWAHPGHKMDCGGCVDTKIENAYVSRE